MIFAMMFPILEEPMRVMKHKRILLTEATYFGNDVEKLSLFKCPLCKSYQLFKGGVYIGCFGCLSYFSEVEIIEANIGE